MFFILFAESMPLWQGMLIGILASLAILALVILGVVFFVRGRINELNKRQDSWAAAADQLQSTIDTERDGIYKPIVGEQDGFRFEASYFSVDPRTSGGTVRVDDCIEVKVIYRQPLDFSLDLVKAEMFYEKVGAYLDQSDLRIGHEQFDSAFTIRSSDVGALLRLLSVEISGGKTANLLDDLLEAAKDHLRVKATDTSITLGNRVAFGDVNQIRPLIHRTVILAERIAKGQKLVRYFSPSGEADTVQHAPRT